MKLKKSLLAFIITLLLLPGLVACENQNNKDLDTGELEYIDDKYLASHIYNRDKILGKGIKLADQIGSIEETEEYTQFKLISYPYGENGDGEYRIIRNVEDKDFKDGDYVQIEGIIKDLDKMNLDGESQIYPPIVEALNYSPTTAMEALNPTQIKKDLDLTLANYDIKISLEKLELAENETRLYIRVENDSQSSFSLKPESPKLVQDRKQYDVLPIQPRDYPSLIEEIISGVTTEGILVFPRIEEGPFKLYIDGELGDDSIKFKPFEFNISL